MGIRGRLGWVGALLALLPLAVAQGQVSVTSPLRQVFEVASGQTYSGQVVLSNAGNGRLVVQLTVADYRYLADGSSSFDPAGTNPRSLSQWLTLGTTQIDVAPGQKVTVPYTIKVPVGNYSGTYWSVILVEGVDAATNGAPPPNSVQVGVSQRLRYAVQVVANLGESGQAQAVFQKAKVLKTAQGYTLQVEVLNQGGRMLQADTRVEIYRDTELVHKVQGPNRLVLPDTSIQLNLDLGTLPMGTYQLLLLLDGGESALFAVRYRLEVKP